jgi:ribosomal protein S11
LWGSGDFDPGPGTATLLSPGSNDIFIAKLDANGNYVWAKSIGGTSFDEGQSIAVDASGNVYVTGYFRGTVDFDPGPGTANLTSPGVNLGKSDTYILKLDNNGNFVWVKQLGGSGNVLGFDLALDGSGNVITTGYFEGTADFDPSAGTFNLVSAGGNDVFIAKLDASGNFVWAKSMGGGGDDEGSSLTLDASGNVYSIGMFNGPADFDPGAGTNSLSSVGNNDMYISKLDANGDFVWAKGIGGPGLVNGLYFDVANDIILSANNEVHVIGQFYSTVDFDPGPGIRAVHSFFRNTLISGGNYSKYG